MGYLFGMVEAERGLHTTLNAALPSLSRPLYECILTGVPPVASGITHNGVTRLSQHDAIFHLARAAGKRTAAAAYYWVICLVLSFFQGRVEHRLERFIAR